MDWIIMVVAGFSWPWQWFIVAMIFVAVTELRLDWICKKMMLCMRNWDWKVENKIDVYTFVIEIENLIYALQNW